MDILKNLRRLESSLTRTVDDAARKVTQPRAREPLEILHAIVAAVEKRIEPAGRGRYVFPFNQIDVSVAAASDEARARFQAVFGSAPSLHDRIAETLAAAGCELTALNIATTYVDAAAAHWTAPEFHVAFSRVPGTVGAEAKSDIHGYRLTLTIIQGAGDKPE